MKKLFALLLVGLLISTSLSFADENAQRRMGGIVVTADDADVSTFLIGRDVLLGITVYGAAVVVGIYDTTTLYGAAVTDVRAEAETSTVEVTKTVWFKYPIKFSEALTVVFNDADIAGSYGVVLHTERDRDQYR